jgi:hypothetical protein
MEIRSNAGVITSVFLPTRGKFSFSLGLVQYLILINLAKEVVRYRSSGVKLHWLIM